MAGYIFISIGSGLTSALLFGSVLSPSLLSIILLYFVPLPLFIAAMGWGATSAAIGGGAAAIALTAVFGFKAGAIHLIGFSAPAFILGYLAMLARSGDGGEAGTAGAAPAEWYPAGRLIIWCAGIAAVLALFPVALLGPDAETFYSTMRAQVVAWLEAQPELKRSLTVGSDGAGFDWLVSQLVFAMVPSAAIVTMLTLLANVWLANKVVAVSGRRARTWSAFSELELPRSAVVATLIAAAAAFVPGTVGLLATAPASTLFAAYTILGLAVIHFTARHIPARPLILGSIYLALFVFSWIAAFAFAALGLAETVLKIRRRRPPRPDTGDRKPD